MARREVVILEDDLDGGTASETVRFGLDGVFYEIDLSGKNAKKMRDALDGYVAVARRVGRGGSATGGRAGRGRTASGGDREQNRAIREWAIKAGKAVSGRGRIPADIIAEYQAKAGRKSS